MKLDGKVAIITGGARGIGLAIDKRYVAEGAKVVIADVDTAAGESAARALGAACRFRATDVGDAQQAQNLINDAVAAFGALDILVNNAGIQHVAKIEDFPADKWDAVIAINLSSSFHAIKAALPGMKQRKWGRIINIASAHGLVASADKVAYVTSKHGLIGLTKNLAA